MKTHSALISKIKHLGNDVEDDISEKTLGNREGSLKSLDFLLYMGGAPVYSCTLTVLCSVYGPINIRNSISLEYHF